MLWRLYSKLDIRNSKIQDVIRICEKYFPRISWYELKGGKYFGGEEGSDQLEFTNDHVLKRFGAGTLDFSCSTEEEVVGWLEEVGMICLNSIESINDMYSKPDGEEISVMGYELNGRFALGHYIDPCEYKAVSFEDMSQYKIILEGNNLVWAEKG